MQTVPAFAACLKLNHRGRLHKPQARYYFKADGSSELTGGVNLTKRLQANSLKAIGCN